MNAPQILNLNGVDKHFNMTVGYVPFSAHSDYNQTSNFIEKLNVKNIILVHGDSREADRLSNKLVREFRGRGTELTCLKPKNGQMVFFD